MRISERMNESEFGISSADPGTKPGLLIVSHVLPYPRSAGQNQRVHYTLTALRERFRLGFLTFQPPSAIDETHRRLAEWGVEPIVIPSLTAGSRRHQAIGRLYAAATGLKRSNYAIGNVEFTADRIARHVDLSRYEIVLFEYFHAWRAAETLKRRGVRTVLDMHDILWRSYEQYLDQESRAPKPWRNYALNQYRAVELRSWRAFDGLIAINRMEEAEAREHADPESRIFYAPMGTDLRLWPYSHQPTNPPRLAFYGGMAAPRNQDFARQCAERIMPIVWDRHPETELWIVGNRPPESIQALAADPRIRVTGFVQEVQPLLATMTAILCPWSGTYGFRSRVVEAMALGLPIIANPDAVAGMELEQNSGVLLADDPQGLAEHALTLLNNPNAAIDLGRLARAKTETLYSLDATYGRLARELAEWRE